MSDVALSIANIRGLGGSDAGQFRAAGEALGWKNKRTGHVVQFKKDELKDAVWVKSGRECSLVLYVNSEVARFDGFQDKDFTTVADHFAKNFNVTIEKRVMSSRGWHWGEWEVTDRNISVMSKDKPLIDLATKDVSQLESMGKTEISLEMKPSGIDDPEAVELLEIRFYVPPNNKSEDVEEGATEETAASRSSLDDLRTAIESVASGSLSEGNESVVTTFSDINMLVPRGRYDLQMSLGSMRFAGKTFSFNVRYDQVTSVFLLPKPGSSNLLLAFSLNSEARQGNTKYRWLVAQISADVELKEQTLQLPAEKIAELGLNEALEGPQYRVLGKIIRAFKMRLLTMPESGFFAANKTDRCIGCSLGAENGHLWLLDRHLIFGHKPMVWVRLENIQQAEFTGSSGNKFFELRVTTKADMNYDFGAIDKVELANLQAFFETKGIRVKSELSSREVDHVPGFSDDEDDSDYEDDEDDEESDDGSFASESDEGSGDEEVEEEDRKSKKSKKEKKEKKAKKEKKEKKAKKEKKEKKSKKSSKGDDDAPSKRRSSDNEEEPSTKRTKVEEVKTEQE